MVISGQSTKAIITALQDVLQCLATSPILGDVLVAPEKFFKQMRAVFAQCEAEDHLDGYVVLLEIINNTFPTMDVKQKKQNLTILIPEIIRCLSVDGEVHELSFNLLKLLWADGVSHGFVRPEFDATILNSNDKRLIDYIKSIMSSGDAKAADGDRRTSRSKDVAGSSSSSSSSKYNSSNGISSSSGANNNSKLSYWSDSDSSATGNSPVATRKSGSSKISLGKLSGAAGGPGAPPNVDSPKVLKLSFLPHSMTEQWLLAHNAEELSFALDEINSVYNALSATVREKAKADMPRALKQIIQNLSGEALTVIISGLRLMGSIAENHIDVFIGELDALFPKLHRYLEDAREMLRRNALRLAVALAARLPFQLTENFITSAVEHKSVYAECALKLAGIGLLNVSSSGGLQVSLDKQGNSTNPDKLTSQQIRAARIAKAAVGYLAIDQELEARLSASGASAEIEQTPRTEATYEVAHDVIAAALLVLCPHEADLDTGIFPETLPPSFISMLLLGSGQSLTKTVQNEISLRASGLSFPSLVKDSDVASQVHMLLAARMGNETNKAMSGGLRNRTDSEHEHSSGGMKDGGSGDRGGRSRSVSPHSRPNSNSNSLMGNSANTGPPSPSMMRVKSKLFDAAAELGKGCATVTEQQDDGDEGSFKYVPTWADPEPDLQGKAITLQAHDWQPNGPGSVDQSKLASLKRFGRKPGSRRAHSAEVQSSSGLQSDVLPAPSTSDGIRGGGGLKNIGDASEEDMGFSPKAEASVGNYLDDEERAQMMTTTNRSSKKPKRRPTGGASPLVSSNTAAIQQAFENLSLKEASLLSTTTKHGLASKVLHSPRGIEGGDDRDRERERSQSNPERPALGGGTVGARYRTAIDPTIPHAVARGTRGPIVSASEKAGSGASAIRADLFSTMECSGPDRDRENSDSPDYTSSGAYYGSPLSPRMQAPEGSPVKRAAQKARPRASSEFSPEKPSFNSSPERAYPSALKPESLEYLDAADIKPSVNPTKDLVKAMSGLETQDWPEIFYTLNTVRQLAIHHNALLTQGGTLHSFVQGVLRQADNLRSAVAKNAILALGDLFEGLEKAMDSEVPLILALLLKKCGDTSIFLIESAERAVHKMIDHVSATRSLAGLLVGTENRNPNLRGRVAGFLHSLVLQRAGELCGARELESLKIRLGKLISDHTPEARASGRDIVRILVQQGIATRAELELHIPADQLQKALSLAVSPPRNYTNSPKRTTSMQVRRREHEGSDSAISSGDEMGGIGSQKQRPSALYIPSYGDEGDGYYDDGLKASFGSAGESLTSSASMHSKGRTSSESSGGRAGLTPQGTPSKSTASPAPSRAKVAAAKRVMESNEDLLHLPAVELALRSANWIERREALTQLTELVIKHTTVLRDASRLDGCVERLLEKLEDGSVKIQLHTIALVERVHKEAPIILPSMQMLVVSSFLNAASSSNK